MATVAATYGFGFGHPLWLLAGLLVVPVVWLGRRRLGQLGRGRRIASMALRCVVVLLLAALLARPRLSRRHDEVTVIVVLDRSRSVPEKLQAAALGYLAAAVDEKPPGDRLGVVDVAEAAMIARLPSTAKDLPERNVSLTGDASRLAGGVQLAMAVAPPETATRILLVSDGNETAGDLAETARIAAANRIPLDVLPLAYEYEREAVFRRLVAPPTARSGETVPLRFVLAATSEVPGRLMLTLNDRALDLDPDSPGVAAAVTLKPGTNVQTVAVPIGTRGMHRFEARFVPDDPRGDTLIQNNRASGITYVAGPGHVLVAAPADENAEDLVAALRSAKLDVRYRPAGSFPTDLAALLDADAVILVNTDSSHFSAAQQEMLCRYVNDLGGGLVMVGGDDAFGAGGWIGSRLAEVLPVDLDPPQKKEMPKGALVMIMHACEMPRGNMWGKKVAVAAVKALSRADLVGVLDYSWQGGARHWVYPLAPAGDKKAVVKAINRMPMGDMPDFGPPMLAAYQALKKARAGQKHMIIISDGDPARPTQALLAKLRKAQITCTGVAVFPHTPADVNSLKWIAGQTGGRFYNVKDPKTLPQIFVKEAQVVRRSLRVNETFTPVAADAGSEVVRGLIGGGVPKLDGYILTGPKGGLARLVLISPTGDPVLATGQSGLGRCVAFTSSADSHWAANWVAWGGFARFWEQVVRWAGKSPGESDCQVFADVQGRQVGLTVEAVDAEGRFVQFAGLTGQVIAPDMSTKQIALSQVGPGRYRASFRAGPSGSYLINLRYRKVGAAGEEAATGVAQSVVTVPYAPEFRDLSDNSALLARVAAETGGRVLKRDPRQGRLFDRAGLTLPETPLPLAGPLWLAWLGLFLLDVAVRRIAVDAGAAWRRAVSAVRSLRRRRGAGATIEGLKSTRQKLRERLAGRTRAGAEARRRYEAGAGAEAGPLPMADVRKPKEEARLEAPPAPAEPRAPGAEAPGHLARLLKAKRKARGEDEEKEQ